MPKTPPRWLDHLATGLVAYYLTSLLAVFGVLFGHDYLRPTPRGQTQRLDALAAFANWDGRWYQEIAEQGYHYNPEANSTVAFFPAFPLAGRALAWITGWRTELALLVLAHAALAACFVVFAAYLQQRWPGQRQLHWLTLLAFGLLPTTFFFRMAYSESLFLLCAALTLYALQRRWPWWLIALIVGLATATRPVGVALLAAMVLSLGRRCWEGRNS